MCRDYDVELLGALPLDIKIREHTDSGSPTVVAEPEGRIAEIYRSIARRLAVKIDELSLDHSALFARIVVEDT
jgi:ATP-binding protein involved in chromosome partitioning